MIDTRRLVAALALSLGLHVAAVAVLRSAAISAPRAPEIISIALLRGGGGGDRARGGASAPSAPDAAVPGSISAALAPAQLAQPEPAPHPEAVKVAAVKPRLRRAASAAARKSAKAPQPPVTTSSPANTAKALDGQAPAGDGHGSGGGAGDGQGSGSGPGRGQGPAGGDSRAFCTYCPEPVYPRIARQRGWQGTVDVAIRVLANGGVGHASVHRSSGYAALDDAALEVARVSRFSPPEIGEGTAANPLLGRIEYRFVLSRSR